MIDHHVDRPDVYTRQRVQLTGPNRPIGSIREHHAWKSSPVPCRRCAGGNSGRDAQHTLTHSRSRVGPGACTRTSVHPAARSRVDWTTWWPWRGAYTRSHPELGREIPQRPWYCVSRHGRVGRRQVLQPIKHKPKTAPKTQIAIKGGFMVLKTQRGVEQPGSSSGS